MKHLQNYGEHRFAILKIKGKEWLTWVNPKVRRYLKVNLKKGFKNVINWVDIQWIRVELNESLLQTKNFKIILEVIFRVNLK